MHLLEWLENPPRKNMNFGRHGGGGGGGGGYGFGGGGDRVPLLSRHVRFYNFLVDFCS